MPARVIFDTTNQGTLSTCPAALVPTVTCMLSAIQARSFDHQPQGAHVLRATCLLPGVPLCARFSYQLGQLFNLLIHVVIMQRLKPPSACLDGLRLPHLLRI